MGCGNCKKNTKKSKNISQAIVCNNLVTSCGGLNIPRGFQIDDTRNPVVTVYQGDIVCSTVLDTTTCTTVVCDTEFTGTAEFLIVTLSGSISYVVNVPIISACGTGAGYVTLIDSVTFSNQVCTAPTTFECPTVLCPPDFTVASSVTITTPGSCDDVTCAGSLLACLTFILPNLCVPL